MLNAMLAVLLTPSGLRARSVAPVTRIFDPSKLMFGIDMDDPVGKPPIWFSR